MPWRRGRWWSAREQIGERKRPPQPGGGLVRGDHTGLHTVQQCPKGGLVHVIILPPVPPPHNVAFLGPEGTFAEQALLTQEDLAGGELRPIESISDVLTGVEQGDVDVGFVPLEENSIEGTVNVTLDTLAFETDLLVQRGDHLGAAQPPGTHGHERRRHQGALVSGRCAVPQLPRSGASHATVEAVAPPPTPPVSWVRPAIPRPRHRPHLAGEVYELEILRDEVEDHPENATRFVVVAREGVPAPTGHDKTTIVVFQQADRPGSLLSILRSSPPAPSTSPSSSPGPPRRASGTTASSSTSRATSTRSWWPTVSGICRASTT